MGCKHNITRRKIFFLFLQSICKNDLLNNRNCHWWEINRRDNQDDPSRSKQQFKNCKNSKEKSVFSTTVRNFVDNPAFFFVNPCFP